MRSLRVRYALLGNELYLAEDVEIVLEGGRVVDIYETDKPTSNVLAMPALINSHVHTADYSLLELWPEKSLEEVVDPVRGLKIRALEQEENIEAFIWDVIKLSYRKGTFALADFREQGEKGLRIGIRAAKGFPGYLPFARPPGDIWQAYGLGLPEINYPKALEYAKKFKEMNKPVAVHFAESKEEDFDKLLELDPDFVIHANYVTKEELEELKRRGIAVSKCLRANTWFNLRNNLEDIIEVGVRLLIGTDNAGWTEPDLWRELEFSFLSLKYRDEETARELLKAVTVNAQAPLKLPWRVTLDRGSDWPLLLLNAKPLRPGSSPYIALVKGRLPVLSIVMP